MKRFGVVLLLVLLPILAHAGQATLNWTDNSTNEAGFKVERTTVPNVAGCTPTATGFAQIGTTLPNVATYVDPNLTEGTTYCFRVRAAGQTGVADSPYSNVASLTIPFTVPAAPSNLTAQ